MLFAVGKVKVQRQVLEDQDIPVPDLVRAFERYIRGDWGDLASNEEIANDVALASGGQITARYRILSGKHLVMTTAAGETVIGAVHEAASKWPYFPLEPAKTKEQG